MNKKRISKKVLFIVVAITALMLSTSGILWLFSSGHLVYFGSSSQSVTVCGTDVVDKYNDAMYFKPRNGSIKPSIDEIGVKNLAVEIKSKANFENDPTCQTIIFWSAVRDDNYKVARGAYDALWNLHKKHIFADSNLRSDQPLFMYEETLKGLTGSNFQHDGVFGG